MTLRRRLARMELQIGGPTAEELRDAIAALARGEQPADAAAGAVAVWIEEALEALARGERPAAPPVRMSPELIVRAVINDGTDAMEFVHGPIYGSGEMSELRCPVCDEQVREVHPGELRCRWCGWCGPVAATGGLHDV